MLEVHRWRHIAWSPSAVVALATSVDGTVVAAARENGAIELWNVAPGSVGWHCHLTIPGKEDAAISSLVWCRGGREDGSPLGRLFSAGLDGFITEWDLKTLQPKVSTESYGGSVWQLEAEPLVKLAPPVGNGNGHQSLQNGVGKSSDNDEIADVSSDRDSDDDESDGEEDTERRVAVACDDGCVRLFTIGDGREGMVYRRSFPRVEGRILCVAWGVDGSRVYAGGSDGCIRCWDPFKIRELFRITAGIGGFGGGPGLCVWSLLALRDGTIVSGDSTGSTQFWEGKHGTLLQTHAKHGADVLALAASLSHQGVFAAGADGQVVLYQHVDESSRTLSSTTGGSVDTSMKSTEKWVFVGSKRSHTHDVRALAVACPVVEEEGVSCSSQTRHEKVRKRNYDVKASVPEKWSQPGTAMLLSGGNDSKLFTYPVHAFLAFHPHDICPAPQRPYIQLALDVGTSGVTVFIAQHSTWVDVWRMHTHQSSVSDMVDGLEFKETTGKRKYNDKGNRHQRQSVKANDSLVSSGAPHRQSQKTGKETTIEIIHNPSELAKTSGIAPELIARIKCKTAEHIACSAVSGNGQYVAFSDRLKPRLYEWEQLELGEPNLKRIRHIAKKKLPVNLLAAQSMQFTPDSTRLLLGCSQEIVVVDVKNLDIVHSFRLTVTSSGGQAASSISSIKFICTSADSQWLAAATISGHVHVFNLEALRHHWTVPLLDGSVTTSAVFRPGRSSILILSTAANQMHVLDVEAKELSEWSKENGSQMSRHLLDFPGGIIGLSVPPTSTSTSVIAYSSRAMCQVDFRKPVNEILDFEGRENKMLDSATEAIYSTKKNNAYANGNGFGHRINGHSNVNRSNFVVVPFKDPVLFLGHTTKSSLLIVEKPWLDVLRHFPAPVYRHLYGT